MSCEFRILDFNYVWQRGTGLTATTEDVNHPVSNLKNQIRNFRWRSTATADQSIVIDFKTSETIDSVALLFDPLRDNVFTGSANIRIQANPTDVWTAPAVDVALSIDEDSNTATHYFSSDQTFRYWRLYLDDPTNAVGYLEVSNLMLCKASQLSQTPDIGFPYEINDNSKVQKNNFGHFYADIYPNRQAMAFDYSVLPLADVDILRDIYRRTGNVRAIAVVLDPTEVLFDKDRFFIYGLMSGDFSQKQKVRDLFDTSFNIEEIN